MEPHNYDPNNGGITEQTRYYLPEDYWLDENKRYEFYFNNESSYSLTTPSSNNFDDLTVADLQSSVMKDLIYEYENGTSRYRSNSGQHITGNIPKLGSNNIEWFTNEDIAFNHVIGGKTLKQRGFVEAKRND